MTATPSFARSYNWNITKAVDKTLVEATGGTATFNYTVNAGETGVTNSNFQVSGTITLTNPNPSAIAGVNVLDAVDNGGTCLVTDANAGANETVSASGSLNLPYTCTYAALPSSGTNTAMATWNKDTYHTANGSASGSAPFDFASITPTTVNRAVSVTDTFNGSTTTLGTPTATDGAPLASGTYTYSHTVNVPTSNCLTYPNTAKIVETGQTASASVEVCGPALTGATGSGSWSNNNGQTQIKNSASTSGVCNLTAWLRQFAPFQDPSATASCSTVASYVSNVIKAANASGASMNAMLKAQMLSTTLSVYFKPAIGNVAIDLTKVCTMMVSSTCSAYANVSSAFSGATGMTILNMLLFQNGVSNAAGSQWYGNVKSTQELAKDAFEAINRQAAFVP